MSDQKEVADDSQKAQGRCGKMCTFRRRLRALPGRAGDSCMEASKPVGDIILGLLFAANILMGIDYVATNVDIALWWLGFVFAGSITAEIVDQLGKPKSEWDCRWKKRNLWNVQFLGDRSWRLIVRIINLTLIAVAAHLFVDIASPTADPSCQNVQTVAGNGEDESAMTSTVWLILVVLVVLVVLFITGLVCRSRLIHQRFQYRYLNPRAAGGWLAGAALLAVPAYLLWAVNNPGQ